VTHDLGRTFTHVLGGDPSKKVVTAGDATDVIAGGYPGHRDHRATDERGNVQLGVPAVGDGGISQSGGVGGAFHYSSGNNLGLFARRNWSGTALVSVSPALRVLGSNGTNAAGLKALNTKYDNMPFITQFALDAVAPTVQGNTRLLIGTRNLYESFDDGATLIPIGGVQPVAPFAPLQPLGVVTAIAYGGFSGTNAIGTTVMALVDASGQVLTSAPTAPSGLSASIVGFKIPTGGTYF
jgi:hypothetical protein